MGWSWLIKISPVLLKIFMPFRFPIPIIKATIFKQFCGGESIEDCNDTIVKLEQYNVKTILDYSVEGEEEETTFDANVEETITSIKKAASSSSIPFSVFKVTGYARFKLLEKVNAQEALSEAEQEELNRAKNRVDHMCRASFDSGVPVFIDAEETWIQDAIDDMALEMMRKYNKTKAIVFNTAQLYRWDRLNYLKELRLIAEDEGFIIGMKLVRGAYMEKERERAKRHMDIKILFSLPKKIQIKITI